MKISRLLFSAALSGGLLWPIAQTTADEVIEDDLIVKFSTCIGFDCASGESFGFDTLRLKENNLRIHAEDTSRTGSFPSVDWRIIFNETTNGGRNVFFVQDESNEIFSLEAGAPRFSLYVEDSGHVGMGTNDPVVNLHIVDGNTPTMRLHQDGSSGFAPQIWDVAGNESNFFIRDVTNASRLPFKIKPAAPTDSIFIAADGDIGFGTDNPQTKLHATGGDGTLTLSNSEVDNEDKSGFLVTSHRTNAEEELLGVGVFALDGVNFVSIGGGTPAFNAASTILFFTAENTTTTAGIERARFTETGDLAVARTSVAAGAIVQVGTDASNGNGAQLTDAGVWTNGSSRANKINIKSLSGSEALTAVRQLRPVTYNGKQNDAETYVGFIAEEVPGLVAMNDRKGIAAMEISAVVTKVVQEHQKTNEDQTRSIAELKDRIARLEKLLSQRIDN